MSPMNSGLYSMSSNSLNGGDNSKSLGKVAGYMESYSDGNLGSINDLKSTVFSNLDGVTPGSDDAKSLSQTASLGRTLCHRVADSFQPLDTSLAPVLKKLNTLQPGLIDQRNRFNNRDGEGDTPLLTAIDRPEKNTQFVNAFLDAGADVNARGISDHTPLIRMIIKKQPIESIRSILERGADLGVTVEDPFGDSDLDLDYFVSAVSDPGYKQGLEAVIDEFRNAKMGSQE